MSKYYYLFVSTLFLMGCSSKPQQQDPIPTHDTFTIVSKQVGESRTINVWMPPGYAGKADSLPVLYMLDGGLQEDFPHIANTIAELVADKSIPLMLLVGIENTQRRRDLTGPTEVAKDKEIAPVVGGSEPFRAFIREELFPEINKRYRTTSEKGIIGESLAGLFVTETFLLYPDMFDFYIAFDPSLWWNNKHLIQTANEHLAKFPNSPKRFWFAGSSAEDISTNVATLAEILKAKDINNLQWQYSDEQKEKHNTIFRATKVKALKWTFDSTKKM